MSKKQLVQEIRLGKIVAAIWLVEAEPRPRHQVTCYRIYKAESSMRWSRSDFFSRDELLIVSEALRQAFNWLHKHPDAQPLTEGDLPEWNPDRNEVR